MFLSPLWNLKNSDFLPNHESFLWRVCEIFLTWFLLVSILKEICGGNSTLSKRKRVMEPSMVGHVISE